jgi:hypothetical protein
VKARAQRPLLGHAAIKRRENPPGRGEVFARVHHRGVVQKQRVASLPFEGNLSRGEECVRGECVAMTLW